MKKRYSRTQLTASLLVATAALAATYGQALANPNGGTVVAGQATIAQTAPAQVTITQSTDKAIINWNSFSIGAGEKTRFVQPSSNSITLNRVTGPDVSQILGQLTANGRIVLVNPNGVFFGKDSQVDVAALIATSHDIKNDDFMAGKLDFTIPGKAGAQIINQGKITVQEGGLVALVAPSVQNSGLITARLGKVALASANSFTIDLYGDNLILFEADSTITSQLQDALGNSLAAAVENSGTIEANGGWVLLTAEVAKNVVDKAINMTGHIKATTVDQQEGTIILKAMGGEVAVSGTLDASAPNGGDGGFIETSGAHVTIDPAVKITTAAPYGAMGQWLIDPTDYKIAASGGDIRGADLGNYLNTSNITLQTITSGSGNGDIFVNDTVYWTSLSKLTLNAYRNIVVNASINSAGGGSVLLRADNTGTGFGTVAFGGSGHITVNNGAAVGIYYNPASGTYNHASYKSDNSSNPYSGKVTRNGGSTMDAFMLVNSVSQLQAMNTNLSGHYALGKDIAASTTSGWNGGAGFIPVGTSGGAFGGIFDGLNHIITSLRINRLGTDYVGLFGKTAGAIRNVGLVGVDIDGYYFVGGLAGYNSGSITNAYTTGGVSGVYGIGGLVGDNSGAIMKSYSTSTATIIPGDAMSHCVGGLVGHNKSGGSIANSYSTGSVSGGIAGGLVGHSDPGSSISNSYSTGAVSDTGGWPGGGLVSEQYDGGNTTSSYWNTGTSGWMTSGSGTGRTTAQMKQRASYAGWDFTNTWRINEGNSYPYLAWQIVTTPANIRVFTTGSLVSVDPCILAPSICNGSDTTTAQITVNQSIDNELKIEQMEKVVFDEGDVKTFEAVEVRSFALASSAPGFKLSSLQMKKIRELEMSPEFSKWLTPEGLEIEKLSDKQIKSLMGHLNDIGIVDNSFSNKVIDDKFHAELKMLDEKWTPVLGSIQSQFGNNEKAAKLNYAADAFINTLSVAGDIATVAGGTALRTAMRTEGAFNKISAFIKTSAKIGDKLVGRPTNLQKIVRVNTEVLTALTSPGMKLIFQSLNKGLALSSKDIKQIKSDGTLWGMLNSYGVLEADLRTGNSLNVANFAAKLITQTVILTAASAAQGQISNDLAKDIMLFGGEFIPVAGGIIAQYNSYNNNQKELNAKDQKTLNLMTDRLADKKWRQDGIFRQWKVEKLNNLFNQARDGA